jgi:hypothetical protein
LLIFPAVVQIRRPAEETAPIRQLKFELVKLFSCWPGFDIWKPELLHNQFFDPQRPQVPHSPRQRPDLGVALGSNLAKDAVLRKDLCCPTPDFHYLPTMRHIPLNPRTKVKTNHTTSL